MKTLAVACLAVFAQGAGVLCGWQTEAATPVAAEWQVSGSVRDETKPLKNIFMTMIGPEYLRTRTDSQGRYSFKGSRPGIYRVAMQKPDDASRARSRTIRVSAGSKVSGLDLVAPKGAVISGRVRDPSGQPVAGMVVEAFASTLETGVMRYFSASGDVTDDRGEYRIAYLPPGAYIVGVSPAFKNRLKPTLRRGAPVTSQPLAYPPRTYSPSGRSPGAAAVVDVAPGEERQGVDIVMEKLPTYCVSFRPSPALPDAGTSFDLNATLVEWLEGRGQTVSNARVGAGEDWQICGVPSGIYKLGLSAYTLKPVQGLGLGTATVAVGKSHVDLGRVELFGPEKVSGRMRVRGAKTDAPLPEGIRLRIQAADRDWELSETLEAQVGKDGSIELPHLLRGTVYNIYVENLPPRHYVTSMEQGGVDVRKEGAVAGAGTLEIQLTADGPRLTGKVLLEDGKSPVPEAAVFLVSKQSGKVHIADSDQSGFYVVDSAVPPGEYDVVAVRDLAESQRRDPQTAARYRSGAVAVKLAAGDDRTLDLTARSQ